MSSAPVFSKGRDLDAAATVLRPWLAARYEVDDVRVDDFEYPRGAGASNETILFRATGSFGTEELVLRVAPRPEYQMFLDPEFRMQFDLLAELRQLGTVRVPEVRWSEDDTDLLGQPFFVMDRMHGQVPVSMPVYNAEGWLVEATPAQRRRLWESAVAQLAAIHAVPLDAVGFVDRPERGATGIEQQVSYWRDFTSWALGDEVPDDVATALDWIGANVPVGTRSGLSWGDARIGNMMFGDDFEVVGVMDWEQASLAGPMADLGWWLMFDEVHSVDQGLERLDGLGTRGETLDLWQDLTGIEVEDLHWHEVFAALKTSLLSLRTMRLHNVPPSQQVGRNMFRDKLGSLLELAPPAPAP